MKFRLVSCLLGSVAGQAAAASAPPTTQIMGTFAGVSVANGDAGYVCALEAGRGAFQRQQPTSAKPNPPVLLAMPRTATYNAKTGAGYKASDGVVVLAFTTAVTGAMRIDSIIQRQTRDFPPGSRWHSGRISRSGTLRHRRCGSPSTSTSLIAHCRSKRCFDRPLEGEPAGE